MQPDAAGTMQPDAGTTPREDPGTVPREDPFLAVVGNLAEYHREHEKYYSETPLADAISMQRSARTLMALAERWREVDPVDSPLPSPFAGAPDLNDPRAIETGGVLFMEGEGQPAEIARIKGELEAAAAAGEQTGAWLAKAMESTWGVAEALLGYPELADLLGERHRIVLADWQAASMTGLVARCLRRAVAILERVDFTPAGLRQDLAGPRSAAAYLASAAELIGYAADLAVESSVLVHDNERRWRVFRRRVASIRSQPDGSGAASGAT